MERGATRDELSVLQSFLSTHDHVYPEKLVTGYFGRLTANRSLKTPVL
jgi:hypothetical protein